MTTIKATCNRCGEIALTPADIEAVHCTDGPGAGTWYTFTCPDCGVTQRKPADAHIITLLANGGVKVRRWQIGPLRPFRPDGKPIDEDALIEFGRWLEAA